MLYLDDKLFEETKEIVLGRSKKGPLLNDFSLWFARKYSGTVLNFGFGKLPTPGIKRYRLQVILQNSRDYKKMLVSPFVFNKVYQREVAEEFRKFATKHKYAKEEILENLFVTFHDFSEEARFEIGLKTERKVNALLKSQYPFVWEIISPVVFYYTDNEIGINENNGINNAMRDEFYTLIKKYDEMNYITRDNTDLRFDSKENLDKNYGGSLFAYFHG